MDDMTEFRSNRADRTKMLAPHDIARSGLQFEFHAYPADDDGNILGLAEVTFVRLSTHSAAKARGGRMAVKGKGPVDIALAGSADWDERYITTAIRSDCHKSGYQFERA